MILSGVIPGLLYQPHTPPRPLFSEKWTYVVGADVDITIPSSMPPMKPLVGHSPLFFVETDSHFISPKGLAMTPITGTVCLGE